MSLYIARQDANGIRSYFTHDGRFEPVLFSKTNVLPDGDLDFALDMAAKLDALVLTDTQKVGQIGLIAI